MIFFDFVNQYQILEDKTDKLKNQAMANVKIREKWTIGRILHRGNSRACAKFVFSDDKLRNATILEDETEESEFKSVEERKIRTTVHRKMPASQAKVALNKLNTIKNLKRNALHLSENEDQGNKKRCFSAAPSSIPMQTFGPSLTSTPSHPKTYLQTNTPPHSTTPFHTFEPYNTSTPSSFLTKEFESSLMRNWGSDNREDKNRYLTSSNTISRELFPINNHG